MLRLGFQEGARPSEAIPRHRVVAEYDNPTGKNLPSGGMGHINGAFSPDDIAQWPVLDLSNADIKRDIAALPTYTEMRVSRGSKPNDAHQARAEMDMKSMPMNDVRTDSADGSMSSMPGVSRMQQRADSTDH